MAKQEFISFHADEVADFEAEFERVRTDLQAKGPLPYRWATALRREVDGRTSAAAAGALGTRVAPEYALIAIGGGRLPRSLRNSASILAGYAEGRRLVEHWSVQLAAPWTTDVLVALHARVLGGNWPAGASEIATEARTMVHPRTGEVVYEGPPSEDIPVLLQKVWRRLAEWRGAASSRAAWAHAAVMAILPFRTGNQGVAELLAGLCLRHDGYSRIEFGSLEHWWGALSESYFDSLGALRSALLRGANITEFVHAHLREQINETRRRDLFERTQRQVWTVIENMLFEARLDLRLADPVWQAFQGREVTAGGYASVSGNSPATATADLTAAAATGLLRKEGERRGRRYRAGDELRASVGAALAVPSSGSADDEQIMSVLRARLLEARGLASVPSDSP